MRPPQLPNQRRQLVVVTAVASPTSHVALPKLIAQGQAGRQGDSNIVIERSILAQPDIAVR